MGRDRAGLATFGAGQGGLGHILGGTGRAWSLFGRARAGLVPFRAGQDGLDHFWGGTGRAWSLFGRDRAGLTDFRQGKTGLECADCSVTGLGRVGKSDTPPADLVGAYNNSLLDIN